MAARIREHVERIPVNGLSYALRRFEVEGAATHEGPRRAVLLLHGFLDAGATWDLTAAEILGRDPTLELWAPDLRGFGATDRIGAGGYYHFPDYVTDVRGIVEHLAPPWLAVVGHSMGGGVATLFAGTFPERVQKLVVLEGLGPANEPAELAVERMRRHQADLVRIERRPRPLASMGEAVTRLAASHPRLPRELVASRAERLVAKRDDGALTWAWDPLHRTVSPNPFFAASYASFLRAIACPTLFVSGGPHGWHPPDEDERLALIANLTRHEIADAGHMMHWTAPAELARVMVDFFRA